MDTENVMDKPEYLKIVRYRPNNQNTDNAKDTENNAAIRAEPLIKTN